MHIMNLHQIPQIANLLHNHTYRNALLQRFHYNSKYSMFPLSDSIKAQSFPLVNIAIIAITVYVFVQQLLAPDAEAFIYQYALVPSEVDFANYASLTPFVTSIFLHGGFLHIISNMWFLWVFGDNVEGYLGKFTYPIVYLLSGIVGGLSQYFFSPASNIPMLGASGAVAGALGAYYVLFPHSKIKTLVPFFGFATIFELGAPFMLGYWFILQLFSGAASLPFTTADTGGVAFWAHVGGFLTGVIAANLFKKSETSEESIM